MDLQYCIARLESNMGVIQALFQSVPLDQARWKPSADKWSLLEVMNHLVDEEVEDFGKRLRLLLEDPAKDWPPIDPPRWAVERQYNSRQPEESLAGFIRARKESVDWLKGLPPQDWEGAKVHPRLGGMRAGDLLHSWVAHDFIHIRQMTRLHYEYLTVKKGSYSLEYAGKW